MTQSKLDILNACLGVRSLEPVSSIETSNPAVYIASDIIDAVNLQIQSIGWWFNQENRILVPDETTKNIFVPADTLSCVPVDRTKKYVQRGDKLYDKTNNVYTFTSNVDCKTISLLPYNELPSIAYTYIKSVCVHDYFVAGEGDVNIIKMLNLKSTQLLHNLKVEDLANESITITENTIGSALLRHAHGSYIPNVKGRT